MCLATDQKEPKIAEQDITVYKLLSKRNSLVDEKQINTYTSPYQGFQYLFNYPYKTRIEESTEDTAVFDDKAEVWARNKVVEHYPELRDERLYRILERGFRRGLLKSYSNGFHSARSTKRLGTVYHHDQVYVECTIPAGSEYYEDGTDLLVSNQIIINKEVTPPE